MAGRAPEPPALHVPGYQLRGVLGQGAAGSVWEAIQLRTGRRVALKIVSRAHVSPEIFAGFVREMLITQRLCPPGVSCAFDSRLDRDPCYLATDLVEGQELGAYIATHKLPEGQVLDLMARVADSVELIHRKGVAHRDLKPENILVTAAGEPKIVDFSFAKSVLATAPDEAADARRGIAIGTPMFMAPEQARGENDRVDARADVYALGVMLFILLFRHHPLPLRGVTDRQIIQAIADGQSRPPRALRPDIDPQLERILTTALAHDPEDRYPSAAGLANDLKRFLSR